MVVNPPANPPSPVGGLCRRAANPPANPPSPVGGLCRRVANPPANPPSPVGDVGLILGSERSPEKEMSTHSSIFVLWTEEPGRLQVIGLQRVRHD